LFSQVGCSARERKAKSSDRVFFLKFRRLTKVQSSRETKRPRALIWGGGFLSCSPLGRREFTARLWCPAFVPTIRNAYFARDCSRVSKPGAGFFRPVFTQIAMVRFSQWATVCVGGSRGAPVRHRYGMRRSGCGWKACLSVAKGRHVGRRA